MAGYYKKRRDAKRSSPSGQSVTGLLSVHRDGYGFVTPDSGGADVFIPARYLRSNLHGDRVVVELERMTSGAGKREGRISRTLEQGVKRIVGLYRQSGRDGIIMPNEQRISQVLVPAVAAAGAKAGQVVVAEITAYPGDRQPPTARITEILGFPDEPEVEVLSVIRRFELPYEFPVPVLSEARKVPKSPQEADLAGRTDLRDRVIVTIDGETARDFDDAVAVQRDGANIRLSVSIADVSHYVRPGTALDKEAYLRGTSVYFPDRCIPMLPEELSNGICSLNPGVDRLTMTAEMLFSPSGERLSGTFYPSVIKSAARLTYTIVSRIVEHDDPEAQGEHPGLVPHLMLMKELALILSARRSDRGSIDFDLPEPEIILDLQGETTAILRSERNLAHRIIEEFMLSANEAVASRLAELELPSLHRIHEPPDQAKLEALGEFLGPLGYTLATEQGLIGSREIKKLLAAALGKPEERLVNRLLLRSMKQARYAAENPGHFGLASDCYTHFTSPIRRYPDLVVHRILKWAVEQSGGKRRGRLAGGPFPGYPDKLPEIGEETSRCERNAMEAERDLLELQKVRFMADKLGQEYDGIVDGVTAFGLFVELDEIFVDGMVHISTLPQDFYRFLETEHTLVGERSGVRYRIGDKLRVVVATVSTERRQIEFTLAGMSAAPGGAVEKYVRRPVKGKKPEGWKAAKPAEKPSRGRPKNDKGGGRRRR
jgi:ribonuclease R